MEVVHTVDVFRVIVWED